MFLALGVGAFAAGIFHLMTHAFFKALLFLGAGSVIQSLSGEQDTRKMGGLRYAIPATSVPFVIATLAITGVPGFSGFFSKYEILGHAFNSHQMLDPEWIFGALCSWNHYCGLRPLSTCSGCCSKLSTDCRASPSNWKATFTNHQSP